MSENITVKNHYIPIAYLKNFLNEDDVLFLYMKGKKFFDNKTQKILPKKGEKSLSSIMFENYFYHHAEIEDKNHIEDFFKKECDDIYNNLIKNIEENKLDINFYETLIKVICLMYVRTPFAKQELEERDNIIRKELVKEGFADHLLQEKESIIKEAKEVYNTDISEEEFLEDVKNFRDGKFDFDYKKEFYLSNLDRLVSSYLDVISSMNFIILEAGKNGFFITCDNPVVYLVPENKINFFSGYRDLTSPYVELYFPLSKKYCLLAHRNRFWEKNKKIKVDRIFYRKINNIISNMSFDYIMSPYKSSFLDKYIKEYIPYPLKFMTK